MCVHPLTFVPDLQDMGRFGLSHVIPLPYHPSSFVNLPNGAQIVAMPLTTGLSGGNNFAWQKVDGTTRADSVTCLGHQAMCPLPAPPPPARVRARAVARGWWAYWHLACKWLRQHWLPMHYS